MTKKTRSSLPLSQQEFDLMALPEVILPSAYRGKTIPIECVSAEGFAAWFKKLPVHVRNQIEASGFTGKAGSVVQTVDAQGKREAVYVGYQGPVGLYTICPAVDKLSDAKYSLVLSGLDEEALTQIVTGWLLSCYRFSAFKDHLQAFPQLVLPKGADLVRAEAMARAIYLVRNLVNLPPNALGPQALAEAVLMVARKFKAKTKLVEDTDLLKENFPLVYAVGDGSERRPRLVDFTWGQAKHPKVTLVGKGVCFDTGGYNLKPGAGMELQKKDMGGAAMALGVAYLVMALERPVRLRVIIPAVENSVSGRSYRPSDILHSRKGLTVEIGNTDAEGRLILADALTLACEDSPDLVVDFSTLTGAGRVATGYEVIPMYSNNDVLAAELQKLSLSIGDPIWQMPLWQGYKADILSSNADLSNNSHNPAGSITAALFLQHFVEKDVHWIHLDHYAWEQSGKPGRPRGGADTGLRAIFALLEQRYH